MTYAVNFETTPRVIAVKLSTGGMMHASFGSVQYVNTNNAVYLNTNGNVNNNNCTNTNGSRPALMVRPD